MLNEGDPYLECSIADNQKTQELGLDKIRNMLNSCMSSNSPLSYHICNIFLGVIISCSNPVSTSLCSNALDSLVSVRHVAKFGKKENSNDKT